MAYQYEAGFIGAGNMGGALARAAVKTVGGAAVAVACSTAEHSAKAAASIGCAAETAEAILRESRFVFWGVKPQMFAGVAAKLAEDIAASDAVFVSMLAGVSLDRLAEMLGGEKKIIRIMPNTPCAVGQGLILYAANGRVSEDELSGIRDKMLEYMESCLKTSGLSMQFAMLTNIIEEKTELLYVGKGAQEQIDRMDQAIVKNTIMAATPRWFRRSDGSVNEQEYADWTKPFVHVDGNLGQDSLQQVQVNMLPGICVQVLNNKIEELKWTTGNTDVTNGQVSSGVTAASAIAALQEASGRSSRASTQSAYRAYARLIRMVIERIRQFYDLPRRFRIAGLSGAEEFVSYCNARLKAQSMGPEALMRTPVFDVTVTAQKHTAYTKLAQNELALQFFQLGFFRPEMEQQALACLDMMDFDGKQQILQKLRSGADAAAWQRMALTLAGRYEPELYERLAGQPSPEAPGTVRTAKKQDAEPARVQQARKRAGEAAQPG